MNSEVEVATISSIQEGQTVTSDTSLSILSLDGITRVQVTNPPDARTLKDLLVEEWIPYFECHKCGKFEYCKYVQRDPKNSALSVDIQCGVAVEALGNYLDHTAHVFRGESVVGRQTYMDAAFYFVQFVLDGEITIGTYIEPALITWWSPKHRAGLFGAVLGLRRNLDKLAECMKSIPSFKSVDHYIFVQGGSERQFLMALGAGRDGVVGQFSDLNVYSYDGDGNLSTKKAQQLVEDYQNRGYRVYVQADQDGRTEDIFVDHKKRLGLKDGQLFSFKYDFETAVPDKLLLAALQALGVMQQVELEQFRSERKNQGGPTMPWLNSNYQVQVGKEDLAKMVGYLLRTSISDWWYDEEFKATELGQFLDFVQTAKFDDLSLDDSNDLK